MEKGSNRDCSTPDDDVSDGSPFTDPGGNNDIDSSNFSRIHSFVRLEP
jgi:hypothetical protein